MILVLKYISKIKIAEQGVAYHLKNEAFYELIGALKDKMNGDKLSDFIEKYSVEEILFAFKGNGFGVNAYPHSKSYNDYLNLHLKIYAKVST